MTANTVNTVTTNDVVNKLLTKKQLAVAAQVGSLDKNGLTLLATAGRGAAAKAAKEIVSDLSMAEAMANAAKTGFTDISAFAALINSYTGQWSESETGLGQCPTRRNKFLAYSAHVYAWAQSAKTEKSAATRNAVVNRVLEIVNAVQAAIDQAAAQAAIDQAAAQAAIDQAAAQAAAETETV